MFAHTSPSWLPYIGMGPIINPTRESLPKDGVALNLGMCRNSFSIFWYLPFKFQLQSWWRMPFLEGVTTRFASFTKQYLFIWLFTFGPLRACPAAFFIGTVANARLLLLWARWRRLGLLSMVFACMLIQCMIQFPATWHFTWPTINVRSGWTTRYFALPPASRYGGNSIPCEGLSPPSNVQSGCRAQV